jgi:hypothetical protein
VEGKLGTVRKRLKKRFERTYLEMLRSGIAPRTRVAKGEPSYASPNLVKSRGVNWNQRMGEFNSPVKTLPNAPKIM